MKSRWGAWGYFVVASCVILVLTSGCGEEKRSDAHDDPRPSDDRPNIVLVLADDFDPTLLRAMPETRREVRDRGVTLENAITTLPMCCPSRSTILTGMYPHNHGVWYTRGIRSGWPAFHVRGLDENTVAAWMHEAGYRTFFAGKYLNGYDDTRYVPPGWDDWNGYLGEYPGETYRLNENGEIHTYDRGEILDTDLIARKAEAFIGDAEDPFFAFVATNAPHSPYYAAKRHADEFSGAALPDDLSRNEGDVSEKPRYVREGPILTEEQLAGEREVYRARLRAAASLDDLVGGVLDALRSAGELKNTYVFFWTDNGYHLAGTHRLPRGKHTPYEEDIDVPMFIRGPGVPGGVVRGDLTSNTDLAPTFAGIAGASVPGTVDGRSLLPLLGRNPPEHWRTALLVESKAGFGEEPPENMPAYAALRTENATYVEYATGETELYDLSRDPNQLENLARTAEKVRISRFHDRLAALRSCAGEACREAED
ncbi:MAG: sulfatase [Rubrobacter sp.]|nr:sulfatase [Rubrobacter sp.]